MKLLKVIDQQYIPDFWVEKDFLNMSQKAPTIKGNLQNCTTLKLRISTHQNTTQKYKVKLQGRIPSKLKTDERKLKTRKKSDQVPHKDENLTGL